MPQHGPESFRPRGAASTSPARALIIAAFDSQLKWAGGPRDELQALGYHCSTVVPTERHSLSTRQIADAGFDEIEALPWTEIVHRAKDSDVVVCALSGPHVRRLCSEVEAAGDSNGSRRPVIVAGWVGLIIEKHIAGYLDRCGADIVAVNSSIDLDTFSHAADLLNLPTENLLLTGLPMLAGAPTPLRDGPIRTVLWADQPTVPASEVERGYAYRRLIDHAQKHPDRTVILKPRHRPGEDTFHRMRFHPADLLPEQLPPNLHVDYRPIVRLLDEADLLLTFSSTAALEALDAGVRTAFVLDLGVHERLGNQVLMESGLLRTFDQIDADDIGEVNPAWLGAHRPPHGGRPAALIAARADALVTSGARPGSGVRATAYWKAVTSTAAGLNSAAPVSRPLVRRRSEHGFVLGTVVHLSHQWLPPAIGRPLRVKAARATGRSFA